jgi:lactate permease
LTWHNDDLGKEATQLIFTQIVDPLGNLGLTCVVALIPIALLLLMLAVYRLSAWLAVLIGSIVTFLLAALVWHMPIGTGIQAYLYGSASGVWNVDWITFWGLVLFNTLNVSSVFENFRRWLVSQGTLDVRVQTMLFAWAFGALLEGLVGFGYPWAVVAPILISLGLSDLDAIRVAAIANNAPVSYGALGAPIIALAAVTGYPLLAMSGSVGTVVAVLALVPPWVLIYLVSGKQGLRDGWPLAIAGSIGYIVGQWPIAFFFGPYLPDITGSIVCFCVLLLLLKVWRPAQILGHGGTPLTAAEIAASERGHGLPATEVLLAWMPFAVLVIVVAEWTGPWSGLAAVGWFSAQVTATAPETHATITAAFKFAPWIGGSAILAAWLIVAALLVLAGRLKPQAMGAIFAKAAEIGKTLGERGSHPGVVEHECQAED